jgi:hypothetical protein
MDPLTALTIGSIAAGAVGNIGGGFARARQLDPEELRRQTLRQQQLRDDAARRFAQEARAGMAGQQLDVQAAQQQAAATMASQDAYGGQEAMNAALALQESRAAQEQQLRAQQEQIAARNAQLQAEENMALAQREADARAARQQALFGALGTAATQGLGVGMQAAAMQRQQSFQQDLLKSLARPDAQQQAVQVARAVQGNQAAQAFTGEPTAVQVAPVSSANMSVAQPASFYEQMMQDYLMRGGN